MKRGQVEMVGLLVIVVLLVVIGLIFLKFSINKGPDLNKDLRTNIETTNLLRAMLRADLASEPVADALVRCHFDSAQCRTVGNELEKMLDLSIKPGQTYKFTTQVENEVILDLGTCNDLGIVASHQITKEGLFIDSTLKLCQG